MPLKAVVFDFDGVILQSVDIKTRAFSDLFAPEGPAAQRRLVEFHEANGGISRFEKFRWLYREVLKRPLDAATEKRLGDTFNGLIEAAVTRCPFVPGALEFLQATHGTTPYFVASGTPEDELKRIVELRGLSKFFHGVNGSPRKKDVILKQIAADLRCAPAELVMVGDAPNDYDAAKSAGTRFIGVKTEGAPAFPDGTTVLPDLRGLGEALKAS
jgi:HAD superfamily hydrolase (TIGR01549 family)